MKFYHAATIYGGDHLKYTYHNENNDNERVFE